MHAAKTVVAIGVSLFLLNPAAPSIRVLSASPSDAAESTPEDVTGASLVAADASTAEQAATEREPSAAAPPMSPADEPADEFDGDDQPAELATESPATELPPINETTGAPTPAVTNQPVEEPEGTLTPTMVENAPVETAVAIEPGPVVTKAAPTLTLGLSSDVAFTGADTQATATLDAGSDPSGRLLYTIFVDAACAGDIHVQSSVVISGNGSQPPSEAVVFVEAGTYSWQAEYAGDANNERATSDCIPLNVSAPNAPSLAVTQGRDVSFGAVSAGGSEPIDAGDAESGPAFYVMTEAVTVDITGPAGPWVVTCSVTGVNDGMELSWQLAGTSDWMPFSGGPCYTAPAGGDRALTYHYRLRVDPTADPGSFAFEITYEVSSP